jgi:hypothetical protein
MDGINIFMPGQVWQYQARPGEENSTLTVLCIDELEEDAIIHIRVDGIHLGNGDSIEHLPFSSSALEASLTTFIKHLDKAPEFSEGYDQWKAAFDSGIAGYWKITVAEVLEALSATMQGS